MPRVTAFRPARPGRVLVELDGEPWRTIPVDVAARSGLAPGLELDRERLRTLRRELRRSEALTVGARVLSRRDHSEQAVRAALERKGVREPEREEALATLRRHGALDDARFAHARAGALAERGLGDSAIAFRLERDGIDRIRSNARWPHSSRSATAPSGWRPTGAPPRRRRAGSPHVASPRSRSSPRSRALRRTRAGS